MIIQEADAHRHGQGLREELLSELSAGHQFNIAEHA
jgi:hypothetical protein